MTFLRRFLLLIASVVLAATLSSCASTEVLQPNVVAAGDGQALVYFIRHKYPPYVYQIRVVADGTRIATIKHKDYARVNLAVGTRKMRIEAADGWPFEFDFDVPRAERVFVLLHGGVHTTGADVEYGVIKVGVEVDLHATRISEAEARRIVQEMGRAWVD